MLGAGGRTIWSAESMRTRHARTEHHTARRRCRRIEPRHDAGLSPRLPAAAPCRCGMPAPFARRRTLPAPRRDLGEILSAVPLDWVPIASSATWKNLALPFRSRSILTRITPIHGDGASTYAWKPNAILADGRKYFATSRGGGRLARASLMWRNRAALSPSGYSIHRVNGTQIGMR